MTFEEWWDKNGLNEFCDGRDKILCSKVWNASILNTPCKICMAKNEVIEMLLPKPAPPDTGDDE